MHNIHHKVQYWACRKKCSMLILELLVKECFREKKTDSYLICRLPWIQVSLVTNYSQCTTC